MLLDAAIGSMSDRICPALLSNLPRAAAGLLMPNNTPIDTSLFLF